MAFGFLNSFKIKHNIFNKLKVLFDFKTYTQISQYKLYSVAGKPAKSQGQSMSVLNTNLYKNLVNEFAFKYRDLVILSSMASVVCLFM